MIDIYMDNPLMYRKRYMPQDIKSLNDDEIIYITDDVIVTKWKTFKPKKEFSNGVSCTFLKKGYKISKFMNDDGDLVYYYCDIIHCDYDSQKNTWLFTDLMADVKVYPDGFVEVVDLAEVAEAYSKKIISADIMQEMLEKLDSLLNLIYNGKLKEVIEKYLK